MVVMIACGKASPTGTIGKAGSSQLA